MYERINHPGIIFPEDQPAKLCLGDTNDCIFTRQRIAELFGCGIAAVSEQMSRHDVPFVVTGSRKLWSKKVVMALVKSRPPVFDDVPEGWLSSEDAAARIGCSRKAIIHRKESVNFRSKSVFMRTPKGLRIKKIFQITE